jgi:hypothetical protein
MPRKKDSFAVALEAAEKRFAEASKERDVAVRTLAALDVELPNLRQTISVLQKQLGKEVMPCVSRPDSGSGNSAVPGDASGTTRAPVDLSAVPPEIAKHLVLDLSGMGSIPAAQTEKAEESKSADSVIDTK